jgi:hypothetical protein
MCAQRKYLLISEICFPTSSLAAIFRPMSLGVGIKGEKEGKVNEKEEKEN